MPEVCLIGVKKRFEAGWAVQDFTLTVPDGACWAVIGPSGAGKSLFLQLIAGIIRPTKGKVIVQGETLSALRHWIPPVRRSIGWMSQDYPMPENRNVITHIRQGFAGKDYSRRERDEKIAAFLKRLGITGLDRKLPYQLSGGEKQRVGLCRALAPGHRLLLLDEPLSAIDPHLRREFAQLIRSLHRELSLTILYVTHYLEEAEWLSDHAILIHEGRILQCGTWNELRTQPNSSIVSQFLSAPQDRRGNLHRLVHTLS